MTSASPAPLVLPPLDKAAITSAAEDWIGDELRLTVGAVERVCIAARLIAGEEETLTSAREARNLTALSIREYGLAATSPVVRRGTRNVRLAEATGISRPALQKLRDSYGEVPFVADAAQTLPELAAETWLHTERLRLAIHVRRDGICSLLAAGWTNADIAKVAQVNASRVAQIKKSWQEDGGTVLPPELRDDTRGSLPHLRTATAGAERIADRERADSLVFPAEARAGAVDLLRRLIGVPILTVTGHENLVLAVRPSHAVVRTRTSPEGQAVPIQDVQQALDRLEAAGRVAVTTGELDDRSAFLGAVLRTLPGTLMEPGPPPLIRLVGDLETDAEGFPLASDDGLTFDGNLTREAREFRRGEQALLRRVLFGAATSAVCALCGGEFPVRFLRAAHIKKRSICTEDERRNVAHIAMAACVFGCDALYEDGFITVDETGIIEVSSADPLLRERMEALRGRSCSAFSAATAPYFAWHRATMWPGPGS